MSNDTLKIWDPLVRLFHWSLVLAFFTAYFTEEDFMDIHTWAGYVVAGLVTFRILWGFIGPRHARFSDFVRGPKTVIAFLKAHIGGHAKRYLGHNPAGGAMVIALLLSLTFTALSGMSLYGADDCAGPLAGYLCGSGDELEDALKEIHEFFANFTLILVFFHVAGVWLASRLHQENLVRAMLTGRKAAHEANQG